MSAAQHTPGPWIACKAEEALHAVRRPSAHNLLGMIICDVGYGETEEVNVANARLIAAAPDLLAALRDVIGWVPGASAWHTDAPLKAVERARAAIAKATGGPL